MAGSVEYLYVNRQVNKLFVPWNVLVVPASCDYIWASNIKILHAQRTMDTTCRIVISRTSYSNIFINNCNSKGIKSEKLCYGYLVKKNCHLSTTIFLFPIHKKFVKPVIIYKTATTWWKSNKKIERCTIASSIPCTNYHPTQFLSKKNLLCFIQARIYHS